MKGLDIMETITKWEDISKYAGQIVAFETKSVYIGFNNDEKEGNYVGFGIITKWASNWVNVGYAYGMYKLFKIDKIYSNCALYNEVLSEGFKIRLATQSEIEQIKQDITDKKVYFPQNSHNPIAQ